MQRTLEQLTADLRRAGIAPDGYGQRADESLEDFTQRLVDSGCPSMLDLESIIAEDIRNNWPHCAAERGI
jgi:hypothetical protein